MQERPSLVPRAVLREDMAEAQDPGDAVAGCGNDLSDLLGAQRAAVGSRKWTTSGSSCHPMSLAGGGRGSRANTRGHGGPSRGFPEGGQA